MARITAKQFRSIAGPWSRESDAVTPATAADEQTAMNMLAA